MPSPSTTNATAAGEVEELANRMLRLLHTADVHLGARHADLGDVAAAQRERQFAAFRAAIDLAIAERVDLFLVAGDLFDSNVQPKRSVERVAAELAELARARIRVVVTPGTHDVYDRTSVYRAYDLAALAGSRGSQDLITVLTPERSWIHFPTLDAVVHGAVFATRRAPHSPMRDIADADAPVATWHIGLVHASISIPGRTEQDEVVITTDEIRTSGLDYLALGHWHSAQIAKAGAVTYAYSGAPEPVALDQDRAGKVLLVTLEDQDGTHVVTVEERVVGRTAFQHLDIDAATVGTQPALITRLAASASADLVLDIRLIGVRPDELDLDTGEIEAALKGRFLKIRVRDASRTAVAEGPLPPAETVEGRFIRSLQARIAQVEQAGGDNADRDAAELRDALRLGRLLLEGHEVTL